MKRKTVTAILLTILCLLSLVSCTPGTNNQTNKTTEKTYVQPEQTGVVVNGTSVFSNVDYTLYIPSSYSVDKEIPLLVALHGGGQGTMNDAKDNRQFFADYTGLNTVAEKYGFIVAYPRQSTLNHYYGYDYWNWYLYTSRNTKEPAAISGVVGEVKRQYHIDSSRVFICGMSAGAAMAQIIAINYRDIFAGCCSVAGLTYKSGSVYELNELQSNGPSISNEQIATRIHSAMSTKRVAKMLVITGTEDTRVNPKNSLVMAQTWAITMNKIDPTVSTEVVSETHTGVDGVNYVKSVHATLNGEEICTLYEIDGMGHCWPGSNSGVSISITSGEDLGYKGGIDLNEVMCEFFGLNK